MTLSKDKKSVIRARIAAALPVFHFRRIETLFYVDERGREVTEHAHAQGVLISSHHLGVTLSAGNRVANNSEIWLYPDGSLHEYLDAATWC
jgi:tRNA pseudouridine-54 N-methylase